MSRYLWLYPLIGLGLNLCWRTKHGRHLNRNEWIITALFWPMTVISLLFDPAKRNDDPPA